jgi:hypothetical protein
MFVPSVQAPYGKCDEINASSNGNSKLSSSYSTWILIIIKSKDLGLLSR